MSILCKNVYDNGQCVQFDSIYRNLGDRPLMILMITEVGIHAHCGWHYSLMGFWTVKGE